MEKSILTIGVSTRALFDLEEEHEIFVSQGARAYVNYQIEHEKEVLSPGPAFGLIRALLDLNKEESPALTEVIIMSQNSADASLRIFNSIDAYGLDISRAALTTGQPIAPYLKAYGVDLYLSADEEDVKAAIDSGVAAGIIMKQSEEYAQNVEQIRIAFDGDCVLFSDEAQKIFDLKGLAAFDEYEKQKAKEPLAAGPFANLLFAISKIQAQYEPDRVPIRTALVTARMAPAHERVIRTLQAWNVRIDEAHFLGGRDKAMVLKAFGAHIFFDDNIENAKAASSVVLSARVPSFLKAV